MNLGTAAPSSRRRVRRHDSAGRDVPDDRLPTDPRRIRSFANYFRNYMGISTIVVAALPIPATALHSIPTYSFQTGTLSVYSSLFCFLVLAFIFFSRHSLARLFFGRQLGTLVVDANIDYKGWAAVRHETAKMLTATARRIGLVALALMLLSAFCVFQYQTALLASVLGVIERMSGSMVARESYNSLLSLCARDQSEFDCVLAHADQLRVVDSPSVMAWYLGIFVFAEAAFVLMASKEYLQELVGLTDAELIGASRHKRPSPVAESKGES